MWTTLTLLSFSRSLSLFPSPLSKDAVTAAAKIRQARDNALAKMSEESDARAAVPYMLTKMREDAEAQAAVVQAELASVATNDVEQTDAAG